MEREIILKPIKKTIQPNQIEANTPTEAEQDLWWEEMKPTETTSQTSSGSKSDESSDNRTTPSSSSSSSSTTHNNAHLAPSSTASHHLVKTKKQPSFPPPAAKNLIQAAWNIRVAQSKCLKIKFWRNTPIFTAKVKSKPIFPLTNVAQRIFANGTIWFGVPSRQRHLVIPRQNGTINRIGAFWHRHDGGYFTQ